MRNTTPLPTVCESRRMGRILGVSSTWLRGELKAGRLPGIEVSDAKALFNPRETIKTLGQRAKLENAGDNQ